MKFIERLRNKEILHGSMLTIAAPEVAEMIAKCGFDWLFMDGEHSPLTMLDWQRLLQAVAGRAAGVIRVPQNNAAAFKQALDIGAEGVIAPQVNNAEMARQIVSWCKYPPAGERGVGLARAQGYGLDFAEYLDNANDDLAVIIQVEHIDAVDNIDEIVTVDGIDAVFIGPYDLSASMNRTGAIDDAQVVAAIARVTRACRQRNIALGYFGITADAVQAYIEQGYNLICTGVDAGFLTQGAQQVLQQLKS